MAVVVVADRRDQEARQGREGMAVPPKELAHQDLEGSLGQEETIQEGRACFQRQGHRDRQDHQDRVHHDPMPQGVRRSCSGDKDAAHRAQGRQGQVAEGHSGWDLDLEARVGFVQTKFSN